MTEHGGTGSAARPIFAGLVLVARESAAVWLRAGQRVVHVGTIAPSVDDITLLGERGLLAEVVIGAMQIVDALGNDDALGVRPRPGSNAVACVHGPAAVGAQIGVPGVATGTRRGGEILAMLVRACETAEISALVETDAGNEESHAGLLRLSAHAKGQQGRQSTQPNTQRTSHVVPPSIVLPPEAGERQPQFAKS